MRFFTHNAVRSRERHAKGGSVHSREASGAPCAHPSRHNIDSDLLACQFMDHAAARSLGRDSYPSPVGRLILMLPWADGSTLASCS